MFIGIFIKNKNFIPFMEEYISKKKDLLEEIFQLDENAFKEIINLHREILNKKESILKISEFNEYISKFEKLEENFDNELEFKSIKSSIRCPFTQKIVKNPFKNQCGHVYEKSILHKYVTNSEIVCPYVGCQSKVIFKK